MILILIISTILATIIVVADEISLGGLMQIKFNGWDNIWIKLNKWYHISFTNTGFYVDGKRK